MAARVVVALRSREVRSALFTAIDSRADLRLAGSATSMAELVSQCRTLEPDVAIVESGLSGRTLAEILDEVVVTMWAGDVYVVSNDEDDAAVVDRYENVQLLMDIEGVLETLPTDVSGP